MWKYWAEKRAGNLTDEQWLAIEEGIARSPGHCMTMGTASTMTSAAEALGFTLPGRGVDSGRRFAARPDGRGDRTAHRRHGVGGPEAARLRDRRRASTTRSRRCLSLGGSTNAVVHMVARRAPRRRPAVDRPLRCARAQARRSSRNIRPAGKYPDGGFLSTPAACARCSLDIARPARCSTRSTVNGKTLGENIAGAEVFNRDVILPRDKALVAQDSLAVLRGNLAPDGAVIKPAAAEAHLLRHTGSGGRLRRLQRHGRAHRRS